MSTIISISLKEFCKIVAGICKLHFVIIYLLQIDEITFLHKEYYYGDYA